MSKMEQYDNVWDALANTTGEAANMRVKTELMRQIVMIITKKNWTQTEAAKYCGVTQPRMNDMLRGRISRFSLDALVNIAAMLGREVHIQLKVA